MNETSRERVYEECKLVFGGKLTEYMWGKYVYLQLHAASGGGGAGVPPQEKDTLINSNTFEIAPT